MKQLSLIDNSVEKFKQSIIIDLIELEKIGVVEVDMINQVKNGKFDDNIEELEAYAKVSEASDSIQDSYKILNNK
jgi:hypothetical protein